MNKKYIFAIEISEDVIYQDEDRTWMIQPAHKEGYLIEPHAIYPQPDKESSQSEK